MLIKKFSDISINGTLFFFVIFLLQNFSYQITPEI